VNGIASEAAVWTIEERHRLIDLRSRDFLVSGTKAIASARFDPPKYLVPGDVVEVEVPGIGTLRNPVISEEL